MNLEQTCQGLELFLSKDKNEKLRERLGRFEEDAGFLEYLEGLSKKDMHAVKIEDLLPIANVLDAVVFPNYPVDSPVYYSVFYKNAISNNKLKLFSNLLGHLTNVGNLEKGLVRDSLTLNSNFGKPLNQYHNTPDNRVYVFSNDSYLNFAANIYDNNKDDSISSAQRLFQHSENNLNSLKSLGFDLNRLNIGGYSSLFMKLYENERKENANNFHENTEKLSKLFKRFDELGFDMYNKQNISKASEWLNTEKLIQMRLLTDYMSKEALIYVSGLHIKNE
ncbi:Uncharacterised protein [uncultured archaeon]|nr:Uncharacterised protein [uncultured archaeon]